VEHRVEQLAAAADVSVDTVRFYQSRGLLPPPLRRGRVAWYGDDHVERLARIRSLQARGLTLATIRRLLDGELDAADEALVGAVARPSGGEPEGALLSADELSERTGIPVALLEAVAREGLLVPDRGGYTGADVEVARAGLRLLEQGLPLTDLLDLAREHHRAVRAVAERAVDLFDEHVRKPLRASGLPEDEAADRLVEAFRTLLPATATVVSHHFTRTLLAVATEHIEQVGGPAELAAVRRSESA
jgi:DNA-binding transcriptional MerR regulator